MALFVPESNAPISTFVELLHVRALRQPDECAYIFLQDGDAEERSISYLELDRQVRVLGSRLCELGAAGERALLLHPPGLDYIIAFFACLYAGIVAVPAYPPKPNRSLLRLQAMAVDAQVSLALTNAKILSSLQHRIQDALALRALHWLATDALTSSRDTLLEPRIPGHALAFLQYTSGSTASPKGVMVTHRNLLHNSFLLYRAFEYSSGSHMVSWVPPYHDMGLILGILQPLYGCFPATLMSPFAFAQNPIRWLEVISTCKATTTCAPNFAYNLCTNKVTPAQLANIDLSSLQVALNAAEPVHPETLDRFVATFSPCGFRREAFNPCYGLAEATLGVSVSAVSANPLISTVRKTDLEHGYVTGTVPEVQDSRKLVGCGRPLEDQQVIIVHPQNSIQCAPGQVGEIWVRGDSIAAGYWNRPEETASTFKAYVADTGDGPFLRTGDLGFLKDGELFITGRLKDLMIIRGRNYYPQDIERVVAQSHIALRPDACAAFSLDIANEEQVVVVQELDRQFRSPDVTEIAQAIRQAVADEHEIQVHTIVLIKHGSIPKTSSGKIQRQACKARFLEGSLSAIGENSISPTSSGFDPEHLTLEDLLAAAPEERQALLEGFLRTQVARLLQMPATQIDLNTSLSFFGFDSLSGLELKGDIEDIFGVVLPSGYFPLGPSISTVAIEICTQLSEIHATPGEDIKPMRTVATEHPLSFGQKALWFLHQLSPQSIAYNITFTARILSELDIPSLHRSFQALVDRHAALRTTFVTLSGEPRQVIQEHCPVHFQQVDASTWSETSLQTNILEEVHRPFDLERGPLFRVTLFTRSPHEHILLLVQHHIVADFWSLGILLHELDLLYSAETEEKPVTLPPLPLTYTDYVYWQNEMLSSAQWEDLWTYWQKRLAGTPPFLDLPTDRPHPAVQTYHGASYRFALNRELTGRLKELAKSEGATLYMCLLAAFQVLLYRYTGQRDILVGSPTTGRSRAKLSGLIGYFVNPIVLRTNLAGAISYRAFLQQVKQTVQSALDHQEYPFALLVERLELERDLSHSALFQVMFVLQKEHLADREALAAFTEAVATPGVRINVGGLTLESMVIDQQTARFDLMLAMTEVGEILSASIEYNTDLFDASTISRLAQHFQTLLEGAVSNPEQHLAELPLLADAERQQVLTTWNNTGTAYPLACIHELFERQTEHTPEKIALFADGQQLTYEEVNRRANQLAHYLRGLGVGPEVPVGIWMQRSPEMIIALLGILKAGGAYVPLEPAFPAERLTFLLRDTAAGVLITRQRLTEKGLPGIRAVCVDADWETIALQPDGNPENITNAENLAYVMYTSGSTGTPKGISTPHRAVVRLVKENTYASLSADEVFLQLAPLSFDASTFEIWGCLLNGARLTIAPPHALSLDELGSVLQREEVSTLWLTAGLFHQMVDDNLPALSRVRQILAGGDVLSASHVRKLLQASSNICLINGYGPTENTTFTSCYPMETPAQVGHSVSIGRPIANTTVYVLDGQMQPVPIGVPGELYTGGDGLSRGYLRQPELTAEKFIPNPFSEQPGARLYRTGDLVRYHPNGTLEFLGRMDYQAKVRGFRIEPGEIETVLGRYPTVTKNVVVVRESTPGDKRLIAYIVPDKGHSPTSQDLRRYLQERLPDYMIPSDFVLLQDLPLTTTGKVDRRALPLPEHSSSNFVPPGTPIEQLLADLWAEVLQVEQVGIYDNFFEMGGHSLLATRLVSRLRSTLQIEIPLQSIFEAPTIASLALKIAHLQDQRETLVDAPITRRRRNEARQILSELNELSDEEVSALLQSRIKHTSEAKEANG